VNELEVKLTKDGLLVDGKLTSEYPKNVNVLHCYDCTIEKGTRLIDIFEYLNKDISKWEALLGNWSGEFIKNGVDNKKIDKGSEVDYLEMYWYIMKDESGDIEIQNFMSFHGLSNTDNTMYSLSLSPIEELMFYEIKVNDNVVGYENGEYVTMFQRKPTLFNILFGLFWEISFYGDTKNKVEVVKDLNSIDMDNLETVSIDELIDEMENE